MASEEIDVLREMVRLAEMRRTEALDMIERLNKYNLAIIAFAGTFLSVLVTSELPRSAVQFSGIFLIISITGSLYAVRPQRVPDGGALDVANDVKAFRAGQTLDLQSYLLDVADLTNTAAGQLHTVARKKKEVTLFAALFLALSLVTSYTLFVYA